MNEKSNPIKDHLKQRRRDLMEDRVSRLRNLPRERRQNSGMLPYDELHLTGIEQELLEIQTDLDRQDDFDADWM